MTPGPDYVAPSSSFFFAPGVHKTSLKTYLPSQPLVDRLMEHYWKAVHVIARTVHRPSFERQYERFWHDIRANHEPRVSFQAVVFAALLSSVISMSDEKVMAEFNVDKADLVENFKQGTEAALARANFLRTTKLETLQAFVMYLVSWILFDPCVALPLLLASDKHLTTVRSSSD
jgi:AcrR family transcriptional regulator